MNSPDPVPSAPPAAIPWYHSAVLRGIIAAVVHAGDHANCMLSSGIELTRYSCDRCTTAQRTGSWMRYLPGHRRYHCTAPGSVQPLSHGDRTHQGKGRCHQ